MTESMHMFGFVCSGAGDELLFDEEDDAVELVVLVAALLAGSLNGSRGGSLKGVVGQWFGDGDVL